MEDIETQNTRSIKLAKYLKNVLPPSVRDVRIHDIHKLNEQGASSLIYSFFLKYVSEGLEHQKDLILRIYRKGFEELGFKEFEVLKVLKENNLPVPAVYYFESNERVMGNPFIILEKISGKPVSFYLKDEEEGQTIVDKMAKNLVRIHELNPNLIQNSKSLKEQYERRLGGLLKVRFFIKHRCKTFLGFCLPRQRRFIGAVKRLEETKPIRIHPSLLHLDYEPDHVFVSSARYIILDWGEASIGDPAFDVAWTYHKLRLGREVTKIDLGEYFVRRYTKYASRPLVNLQFWKDMVALELASWSRLSPFLPKGSKLRNYTKLLDITFGNVAGRILEAKEKHRKHKVMAKHHNRVWSNIDYIQSYVTQYLEKDRYEKIN